MQFDDEFASPPDYANLYRDLELQVVPAKLPSEDKAWKRPAIKWREHENFLVEEKVFQQWYGADGEFRLRPNMGVITGRCSGGLVIVDLDSQKTSKAMDWWNDLMDDHHHGQWIRTPVQITGGGGYQILFRCPEWYTPPTNKTNIGIDIRGQGGFAMLPPSLHESGRAYSWMASYEPWNVEIATIPEWLIEAIDDLILAHGGATPGAGGKERTDTPEQAVNAFGSIVDGREDYMRKLVWAKIVDLRRDALEMNEGLSNEECRKAFVQYEQTVKSRIEEPGTANADLLEREGRGWSEFRKKWHIAMSKWETDIKEAAKIPKKDEAVPAKPSEAAMVQGADGQWRPNFEPFPIMNVAAIKQMPDQQWIIDKIMPEDGLGLIYGSPGDGKTFVVLSQCLSIAAGLDSWFGYKINKHGPVIYITTEGVNDLKFRIAAWERETGISADDIPFYLIPAPVNFMDEGEVERLILSIQHSDFLQGECPVTITVDTVSRVMPGADENLQKDMTLFIKACDKIKAAFKTTVTGVHHTNKNGGMRGSTVLEGASDFIFHIFREEGSDIGEFRAKKLKAAADGWTKRFKLKEVVVDVAGNTSLYAEPTDENPDAPSSSWPSRYVCQEILKAMSKAWELGKPWSNQPNTRRDGRYAPMIMTRWELDERLAAEMVETWLLREVIEIDMIDTKTRTKGIRVISDIGMTQGGYYG